MIDTLKNIIDYLKNLSETQSGKNILYILLGASLPLFFIFFQQDDFKSKSETISKLESTIDSKDQRIDELLDENKNISFNCDERVSDARLKALETVKKTVDLVDQLRSTSNSYDKLLRESVDGERENISEYEDILDQLNKK